MLRLDNFAVGGLSFRASTALLKRHQCAGKKVISIATRLDGIITTLHRQLSCIIMFTNHKVGKTPQDKKMGSAFSWSQVALPLGFHPSLSSVLPCLPGSRCCHAEAHANLWWKKGCDHIQQGIAALFCAWKKPRWATTEVLYIDIYIYLKVRATAHPHGFSFGLQTHVNAWL